MTIVRSKPGPGRDDSVSESGAPLEMAPLFEPVRTFLRSRKALSEVHEGPHDQQALLKRFGAVQRRSSRNSPFMLSSQVAIELGHPTTASCAAVLCTYQRELVCAQRVTVVGGALEAGSRYPFAQVVLLALEPEQRIDPIRLEGVGSLSHCVAGYMVRNAPGRLWARIGKQAWSAGLSLATIGALLCCVYVEEVAGIAAAEVVLVASSVADVEALALVARRAAKQRQAVLAATVKGANQECDEVECRNCENEPTCDTLRDVASRRTTGRLCQTTPGDSEPCPTNSLPVLP